MDWLPGATKSPMHEAGFDWQTSCASKFVIHTTEGFGWPDYPSQYEPHLTVKPIPGKGIEVRQHIAFSKAAYALKHTGAAPTNGAHAIQVELIGTSDPSGVVIKGGGYFWPNADDVVLKALWDQVFKPVADAFKIPLVAPHFLAYPASYGSTAVRFTDSQWLAFNGFCGHQHIPGNDHGDPGAFPFARLVALAGQQPPKPSVTTIHGPVRYGATGADVRAIQKRLDAQLGVSVGIDGVFGRETLIALENWQKKHSLTADGVVGPATAKSMGFAYSAK